MSEYLIAFIIAMVIAGIWGFVMGAMWKMKAYRKPKSEKDLGEILEEWREKREEYLLERLGRELKK